MPRTFSSKTRGASRILGTGRCIPENVLTNKDFEKIVDTSDEWITARTGMKVRHIVSEDQATSDLATEALLKALADAGLEPADLDSIIIATATPDTPFPGAAYYVQRALGLTEIPVFDISAACSGFIYATAVANGLIAAGMFETIGVVGAECLTRITNYEDRSTCVLFGDGAGAVVLGPGDGESGVIAAYLGADGNLTHLLNQPAGGSRLPASHETVENRLHSIHMEGAEVFKSAVRAMESSAKKALELAGIGPEEVDLLIPHQANVRIIKALATRVDIPNKKVYVNVQEYGNTSAASIPIALDEAREKGIVTGGSIVMMVAFGGGFTWGSLVVKL